MSVRTERRGPVSVLWLDRPQVHNAVDAATAVALAEAIWAFCADAAARVLVVTGAGERAFCAGADLTDVESLLGHPWVQRAGPMGFARLDPGKPTLAAVNGYCFAGGMELAAWCDFRIAASNAEFGALNRRWGVPFVDGGTQRFPRLVGVGNALWLIETGIRIDAARAESIGFVSEVVPAGRSLERAVALAEQIAEYPQSSLRGDRRATLAGFDGSLAEGIAAEAANLPMALDAEVREHLARFAAGARPEPPRPTATWQDSDT